MVAEEGFTIELTGADASAQNAVAESPHKYLGNMMRCLLHAAGLGPEYWSFTLTHAAFIKNRIPHYFIKKTPFEAITGTMPDLSNLCTFGCRIFVRKPRKRPAKLDHHSSNGIFLGYTATTRNVYYIDDTTGNVKVGAHATFDETHFTVPKLNAPLAAQALQTLGYTKPKELFENGQISSDKMIKFKLTSEHAIPPTICTSNPNAIKLFAAGDVKQYLQEKHSI